MLLRAEPGGGRGGQDWGPEDITQRKKTDLINLMSKLTQIYLGMRGLSIEFSAVLGEPLSMTAMSKPTAVGCPMPHLLK